MSSAAPLSHHDILRRVAPFARGGWQVDLASSDRNARRLAFRPRVHDGSPGCWPACVEHLTLDLADERAPVLTRVLTPLAGPPGILTVSGSDDLAVLLQALERQPPERQFDLAGTTLIGWELQLRLSGPDTEAQPLLRAAEAHPGGAVLRLEMSRVASVPADVVLRLPEGRAWMLPDDLFAVLGREWGLHPREKAGTWITTLLLRGRPPRRSVRAMVAFRRAVDHLACTLAEPPAAFHRRCAAARWAVALRRSVPLLVGVALMAGALWLHRLPMASESTLRMLVFNAPPILLVIAFSLRELPRFELPRWPRPSARADWRAG